MGRPRKFDYDVARQLRDDGWTLTEIAEALGVSTHPIRMATDPKAREMEYAKKRAFQQSGTCPVCGGPSSRNAVRTHRCRECFAKSIATSVAENGLLRCQRCREWKEPEEFSYSISGSISRGFRRGYCRSCDTRRHRLYTQRLKAEQPEKYAAMVAKHVEQQRERRRAKAT